MSAAQDLLSETQRSLESLGLDSTPAACVRTLKRDLLKLLGSVSRDGDDVDAAAADRSGELMRTALREALRDEERQHAKCRDRVDEVELELRETRAAYEVALDSERVERVRTQAQARKLQAASAHADVFADYERKIDALNRKCDHLATKNIELELECAALAPRLEEDVDVSDTEVAAALSMHRLSTARARQKTAKRLEQTTSRLEAENTELKARLRRMAMHEANRHRSALDREKRRRDTDRAELEAARRELGSQTERNAELQDERRDLVTKLKALRDYVKALPIAFDAYAAVSAPAPPSPPRPPFHVTKRIPRSPR